LKTLGVYCSVAVVISALPAISAYLDGRVGLLMAVAIYMVTIPPALVMCHLLKQIIQINEVTFKPRHRTVLGNNTGKAIK
jgi:hypothetical protein